MTYPEKNSVTSVREVFGKVPKKGGIEGGNQAAVTRKGIERKPLSLTVTGKASYEGPGVPSK